MMMRLVTGTKKFANNITKALSLSIVLSVSLIFEGSKLYAQVQLPEVVPGEIVNSIKGTTLSLSSSSGGKSSLSFGSNTSFGTASSVSATSGAKVESVSTMGFESATLTTRLGGDTDSVTADIGNIRASDVSSITDGGNDTTIDSGTNTYSNGNADITGIFQENLLNLSDDTLYTTKVSTIHGDSASFEEIKAENVSQDAQTASASSSASLSTNTNVDINTSEFSNSFQQAY